MQVPLFTELSAKRPDLRHAITAFEHAGGPKELLAARFEAIGDDFSPHKDPLQAEISRTIAPSQATLNQFSQIRGVGVEDARAGLLAGQVMLFSQQRQGMGWLRDPSEIDQRSYVGTGTSQTDIAQRSPRAGTHLDDVLRGNLPAEMGTTRQAKTTRSENK